MGGYDFFWVGVTSFSLDVSGCGGGGRCDIFWVAVGKYDHLLAG